MPENESKQYYVQLPGAQYGQMWDADKYERNKEQLFKKYPETVVAETSSFNPEDESPADFYTVHLPDSPQVQMWDADKFNRNREKLFEKYPGTQVSRGRMVDYYGEELASTQSQIDEIQGRYNANKEKYNGLDWANWAEANPDFAGLRGSAAESGMLYNAMKEDKKLLDELYTKREANPAYQSMVKRQQESLTAESSRINGMINSLIEQEKQTNPDAAAVYSMRGSRPDNSTFAVRDQEFEKRADVLLAASLMYDDALKTAKAASRYDESKTGFGNFFRGLKGGAGETLSIGNLIKAGLDMNLVDAIKKIHENAGEGTNIVELIQNPDKINYLSAEEKELVKAFVVKSAIDAQRAGDISLGYQSGQTAIKSLGFMADFLMFGGVGEAAANWATKGITKGIAKATINLGLKGAKREIAQAVPKFALGTAKSAVKTLVMTPMMPSSYANFVDNLLQLNSAGDVDLSGKALLGSAGDVFIETLSESAGPQVEAILGAPIKVAWKAGSEVFKGTKFIDWAKIVRNAPVTKLLKQAGWNGYIGEIGEEWYGNALRVLMNVDKNALKDFATVDQQIITLTSFAPMALFGGGVSAAQYGASKKKMANSAEVLSSLLKEHGYDEKTIQNILDVTKAENPKELADRLAPVVVQVAFDNGKSGEVFKAVCDYADAVARYRVFDGVHQADVSDQRKEMREQIQQGVGGSKWYQEKNYETTDGKGVRIESVRTITDADGRIRYVVSEDENGLGLIDNNGQTSIMGQDELAEKVENGEVVDSGNLPMSDYLDRELTAKKTFTEQTRMEIENGARVEEIRQKALPGVQVNIGTAESPVVATIIGWNGEKFVVESAERGAEEYDINQMAAALDIDMHVETDEEIENRQADEYITNEDFVKKVNAAKGMPVSFNGQEFNLLTAYNPHQDENGTWLVDVLPDSDDLPEAIEMPISELRSAYEQYAPAIAEADKAEEEEKIAELSAEETAVDNIPRDFRGNPLPLKEDGSVNQTSLWNNDPEAWAKWNDANPNKRIDTKTYVQGRISSLEGDIKKLEKAIDKETKTTGDFDTIEGFANQIDEKRSRQAQLQKILDNYAAEEKAAAEKERVRQLELGEPQSISQLATKVLQGVKAHSLDRDSFKNELGWGNKELSLFFPWWAKKGTGKSLDALAEEMVELDGQYGYVPMVGDAEQKDTQVAKDALIDVMQSISRPGELRDMVLNENKAFEDAQKNAEEAAIEADVMARYGMTMDEYNALSDEEKAGTPVQTDEAETESVNQQIEEARQEVNTNPSEAQKEAGNYKMGHISLDGLDISLENPKGSVRRGRDKSGKEWETTMHYDYGYIRSTMGVDGDHIDVFLSDNPSQGNVYVVDQVRPKIEETISPDDLRKLYDDYQAGKFRGKGSVELKELLYFAHPDLYGYDKTATEKLIIAAQDEKGKDLADAILAVVKQQQNGTEFDEHKVMYGFNSVDEAKAAYLSNYEEGWQGLGNITPVSKEEFSSWLQSSTKKTKPFAEYASVKPLQEESGVFGPIFHQFVGKPKEAIMHLRRIKTGEAVGALTHKDVGDISIVYGDEKAGLAKIDLKHPEVVDNIQDLLDKMEIVQQSDNRIKLESNTHFAVVSKDYLGNPRAPWLLTAFEKKNSALDNTMDTGETSRGGQNDTTTLQNTVSEGKGSEISEQSNTSQANLNDRLIELLQENDGNLELVDVIDEQEAEKLVSMWDKFTELNDKYGEEWESKSKELNSKDKKVKQAAEKYLKPFEDAKDAASMEMVDYYNELLDKYELSADEEEEYDEDEPESRVTKAKEAPAPAYEPSPNAATEEEIEATEVTQDEIDLQRYGGFMTFVSKKTGEKIQQYGGTVLFSPGHESGVHITRSIGDKGARRDGDATPEYLAKYLKANGFEIEPQKHEIMPHKNKYGYWVNSSGVLRGDVIILESSKKGWANSSKIEVGQYDDGSWFAAERGLPLAKGGSEYKTKSQALIACLNRLKKHYETTPKEGNAMFGKKEQQDEKNLIKHLETKVIPAALLEEGNGETHKFTQDEVMNFGESGSLFGDADNTNTSEEPASVVTKKESKPKSGKKKQAEQQVRPDGALFDTGDGFVEKEDEELTEDDTIKPTEVICLPDEMDSPQACRIHLYEKDGKWQGVTEVWTDNGSMSKGGVNSSYPHKSRNEAIKSALSYFTWYRDNVAKKKGWGTNGIDRFIAFVNEQSDIEKRAEASKRKNNSEASALDELRGIVGTYDNSVSNGDESFNWVASLINDCLNFAEKNSASKTGKQVLKAYANYNSRKISAESKRDFVTDIYKILGRKVVEKAKEEPTNTPEPASEESKAQAPEYGSQNTIVSKDRYEELKKRMLAKLNNLNAGFDPETFAIGCEMAAYHIEAGARKFVDFSRKMIADLGDAIRPYLKSFYNGAKDLPGMEGFASETDSYETVSATDVNSITLEEPDAQKQEVVVREISIEGLINDLNRTGEARFSDNVVEEAKEEISEPSLSEEQVSELRSLYEQGGKEQEKLEKKRDAELQRQLEVLTDAELERDIEYSKEKKDATFEDWFNDNVQKRRIAEFLSGNNASWTVLQSDAKLYGSAKVNGAEDFRRANIELSRRNPSAKQLGTITKDKHTKTGEDLWIVKPSSRVSNDEFKELKSSAKTNNGYWSSFKHGFIFSNEADAENFNNSNNIENGDETDNKTMADTAAIVSEAGTLAEQAQTLAESTDAQGEEKVNETIDRINSSLEHIDAQLAILGRFERSHSAVQKAMDLASSLSKDLHIYDHLDKIGAVRADGNTEVREVWIRRPLGKGLPSIKIEISVERGEDGLYGSGIVRLSLIRGTQTLDTDILSAPNYQQLLGTIRGLAKDYLPGQPKSSDLLDAAKQMSESSRKKREESVSLNGDELIGGLFSSMEDSEPADIEDVVPSTRKKITESNGYKIGDKVLYTRPGDTLQEVQTIVDFEDDGRPVLDSFGASWIHELADWENIERYVEPLNTESNDSRRSTGENREVGEGDRQTDEQSVEGGMAGYDNNNPADNEDGSGGLAERNAEQLNQPSSETKKPQTPAVKKNTRNNRVERGEDYAPKTPAARFNANVAAIKKMRELTEAGLQASKEDMAVLRQFTGWGGLGSFFNDKYSAQYRQLNELLSAEEMKGAELSINTAYYTPSSIIDQMWEIAKNLGFTGGKVLEGSAGVGNILASMPKRMSESSDITAVEIDSVTGNILKLLYPDAEVHIQGFEETRIPNNSIDLAITNVPFGENLTISDEVERDLSRKMPKIHDFCIAKNVRKLKEGGIGIFITSRGTLDKSKNLRQWVVNEGGSDFIGAFRLHNETFTGAPVTSDIIVIRKRVNGKVSPNAIDVSGTTVTRRETYTDKEGKYNRAKREFEYESTPVVMEYNSYFAEHPEDMGGEMLFGFERGDTFRPKSIGLFRKESIDQDKALSRWARRLRNDAEPAQATNTVEDNSESTSGVKEGQIILNSKGEICVSRQGKAVPLGVNSNKVKGYPKASVVRDYDAIKRALNDVLQYQLKNESDEGLKPLLSKLNAAYDTFVRKYGQLNRNTAISFLREDVDFSSTAAVENYRETESVDGKKKVEVTKTDIFKKRMIGHKAEPKPTSAKDGVIVSMNQFGRIDLGYIAKALGREEADVRKEILESGIAFVDPVTNNLEVSYRYLAGNVREKLSYAKMYNENGDYDRNIEALEKVVPLDIPAHLIEFSLGSDWIDRKLYIDYAKDRFNVGDDFELSCIGGVWQIVGNTWNRHLNEKNRSAGVTSDLVGKTVYGHQLMIAAMNNSSVQFSKVEEVLGEKRTITDKEAAQAAVNKIAEMKDDFKEWCKAKMLEDTELATRVQEQYNNLFNAYAPMEIGDSFIPERFEGSVLTMGDNPFSLYKHQKTAVIRGTIEPLMLAHQVGSGKTYTLISTAMEMRRLGTAKKPLIVVQNATTGQFVASAKALYPNAKVLTVTDSDHSAEGRATFYAKIKYNDWDLIIVPQSVFDMMPDSEERKREYVQEKIDEKMYVIQQAKAAKADAGAIQSLQKELKKLEEELNGTSESKGKRNAKKEAEAEANAAARAKKQLSRRVDDVSDFDDMGIDAVLVDEAHAYKKLGFSTSIKRGVKGVDSGYSQRSAGLYLKTRSVFDKSGWKNVVFATGTPISNTAAEIWTFMKYLMPAEVMKQNHIYYFDDFVRNFGNIAQTLEFATNGKFRENTRFGAYVNVPELVRIWASVCDTVLTEDAEAASGTKLKDKLPALEGGKAQDIYLPQSPTLVGIMNGVRAELEAYEKMSGKEKKENSHIPLTEYGKAKRAAIDPRLVKEDAKDEPVSKTNKAVEAILEDLKQTESYKGTVAVFCDNYRRLESREGEKKKVETFNLFEDMKSKLVAAGVPESQIAIIESGMNDKKKLQTFAAINAGDVRVVFGSTQTLGTGVNIQERLHLAIHMDAPDRPSDYDQRNGRILRQGNKHKEWNKTVKVLRFGVEDSLDVTSYQRLRTKSAFIDSIMKGKQYLANSMEDRVLEEEEEGLFDNPVAVLSGSQFALKKTQAERELRKYQNKLQQHNQDQIYIERQLKDNAQMIEKRSDWIEEYKTLLETAKAKFSDGKAKVIELDGTKCHNEEELGKLLRERIYPEIKKFQSNVLDNFWSYNGIEAKDIKTYNLSFDGVKATIRMSMNSHYNAKGEKEVRTYYGFTCPELGIETARGMQSFKGSISFFNEELANGKYFSDGIKRNEEEIRKMQADNTEMNKRRGKPFADADKLEKAKALVDEYTEKMRAELAEKEAKYAAMNIEAIKVEDEEDFDDEDTAVEHNREFDENSAERQLLDNNDPIVVAQAMTAVRRLQDRLGVPVRFVRGSDAKGHYTEGKNEVVINIGAHESIDDVIETYLHEAVAHFGLRQLMGDEFDSFIESVWDNCTEGMRGKIRAIMRKNGWDRAYATEEYIAELAQKTDYSKSERSLWRKIVDMVRSFINSISGRNSLITDDTIREILVSSYRNLESSNDGSANNQPASSIQSSQTMFRTAYHGSKADFDKFDLSHVGEGEGAQAHGYGVYVAFDEKTGTAYADKLTGNNVVWDGLEPYTSSHQVAESVINIEYKGNIKRAKVSLALAYPPSIRPEYAKIIIDSDINDWKISENARNFYKIEIPENDGTNYIDEMKTLPKSGRRRIADVVRSLPDDLLMREKHGANWLPNGVQSLANAIENNQYAGLELRQKLVDAFGTEKFASDIFSNAGFVGMLYDGRRDGECAVIFNTDDLFILEHTHFRLREKEAPQKTGIGYKVFYSPDGGKTLYPPMVANPNGESTPVGVWLDADAAPVAGLSKTGRPQVKAGGKGTQGGSGQLAYRPGWHLGTIPYAIQFNRKDANGERTLFPKDFVWAEVEYAADKDYQKEANAEGINANGKYQHSYAGLKRLPEDGFYMYRTNPNPETDPWIITGAMKVNKILTKDEVDELVRKAGREPQNVEGDSAETVGNNRNNSNFANAKSSNNGQESENRSERLGERSDGISERGDSGRMVQESSEGEGNRDDERYLAALGRELASYRRSIAENLGRNLVGYSEASRQLVESAKKSGIYYTFDEALALGKRRKDLDGSESVLLETETDFIKIKDFKFALDKANAEPGSIIQTIQVFNKLFPDTKYALIGVTEDGGDMKLILSQRKVSGNPVNNLSEIDSIFERNGFLKGKGWWNYFKRDIRVYDVNYSNILKDDNGNYHVIDCFVGVGRNFEDDSINDIKPVIDSQIVRERAGLDAIPPADPTNYKTSTTAKRLAAINTAFACGVKVEIVSRDKMPEGHNSARGLWKGGKIYVCLENNIDRDDVARTVLHEAVGHEGLRKLVGNENMTSFCLALLERLPEAEKRKVVAAGVKNGGNFALATEEYLAGISEEMDFSEEKNTVWGIISDLFHRLLAKLGLNLKLRNRDLRWILWQSYYANKQTDMLVQARRYALQHKLGFSLGAQKQDADINQVIRAREADEKLSSAHLYNKEVSTVWARLHEVYTDLNDSVNTLVSSIEKASGKEAKSFEDIRLALNQQSSKGLAAVQKWANEQWIPLVGTINSMVNEYKLALDDIERYTVLKHGLERNKVLSKRDAREYYQSAYSNAISRIENTDWEEDVKAEAKRREKEKLDKHLAKIELGTDPKYKELRKQDYSGIISMYSEYDDIQPKGVDETEEEYQARVLKSRHPQYENLEDAEQAAEAEVVEFEMFTKGKTTELWKRINSATKSTLKHQYEANNLSKEQYNAVKDMFEYYVPLRGFKENTAEDMYSYYTGDRRNTFTSPLLRAGGRGTEADSPFGYIASMAESAIAADTKNETKLALYYFISNRPDNDLVSIAEVWYENTGIDEATGKRIFTPVYPPFKEDLTTEGAKQAFRQWEAHMKEKAAAGLAFKGKGKLDLHNSVIHISEQQKDSHIIKFRLGGKDMMMYINGNPRAAQALNNELNVETSKDYQLVFGRMLRWFSGINTSYNPEFWLSNAQRDALFAIMAVDIKEDDEYGRAFRRNYSKLVASLAPRRGGVHQLMVKYRNGELGDSHIERLYKEFVEGGGVTGYTALKGNEQWERELRNATASIKVQKELHKAALNAIKTGFEKVSEIGESIEQMTRFAAFMTSREQGKDIKQSVADAKELTVNFNRKGSGKAISWEETSRLRRKDGKKLTWIERVGVMCASWLPAYGRRFIMFFNASVQALNTLTQLHKKNIKKALKWDAAYLALGVIGAALHALLDDDDDYLDIPDYERRNNLLVGGGGVYFKWALPQEMRVFYGFGDMVVNHALGRSPHKGIGKELLDMIGEIAPLDATSGLSAIAPSALAPAVEVMLNKDYKGSKVYNDLKYLSDEERKRTPAYQQAYQSTGRFYVDVSKALNSLTGGDYADAGWLNINPAIVEHLLKGVTGGAGTTVGKFYRGTLGQVFGEDLSVRNTPFLSRILTINDERYRNAHTTELFYYYKAEAEHTKKLLKQYSKAGDSEKINDLYEDGDVQIMHIYEGYKAIMKRYNDLLKIETDSDERRKLMAEQDEYRKQMIKDISEIK